MKRVLSYVLVVAMCVTLLPLDAFAGTNVSGKCEYGDWAYYILTNTDTEEKIIRICEYKGTDTEVTVPATINVGGEDLVVTETYNSGYPVFKEGVTKITFQEGFKKVGERTCQFCTTLEEVVFPDSVEEIANCAFLSCALTEVKLPANLKKIGSSCVFQANKNLTTVDFSACTKLTEIGENAFSATGLTSIDLSACEALTTIGKNAFQNNSNLTTITLPEGAVLTNIGDYAFYGDPITSFDFDGITTIGNGAFKNTLLDSFIIPESVKSIGNEAFYGTNITEVTIPSTVTQLGENVFRSCKLLTGIDMSASTLETVPAGICWECSELAEVKFSDSMTGIGNSAFDGTGITTITLPSSLQTIGGRAFAATNLSALVLPDSVTTISESAFGDNANLVDITWPDNAEFTTVSGFDNCSALGSDVIGNLPSSVTTIGKSAFENCRFTELQLPESVVTIGENAFADNTGLTTITTNEKLRTIGNGAFSGCSALANINLAAGVRTISDSAFRYCRGLEGKAVELPKTVKTLENNAFADIGSSASPLTIYAYNQNINIAETTNKTLPVDTKFYCNPFYDSYINLYAFQYDDNGDDTFIMKYQKAFNNVYADSTSMKLTLTGLDKTEYSHKVSGSVPEDAVVYIKKDGADYVQVANNNGAFEQQVTEGNNVFVKVTLDGYYDKYFMKLDTEYTADWKVCELTVNDFEATPVTGTMEIKLSRTDNENLLIERSKLNFHLFWNEQQLVEGTDYTVQLPNIYVNKADIGDEDELTLQVVPDSSQAFSTSTAVSTKKNGTFDVKMIPWGTININVTGDFAGYNNILIFDEAGNIYRNLSQPNGTYALSEIREGTYTVAAFNANSYFSSVNTLSALNNLGLQNGTDYISAVVQVSDGNKTNVDLAVPVLGVTLFERYIDTNNSNVIIENTDIITGQSFKARVNYSLVGRTSGTIRFMLPADAEVTYIYNGNEEVPFTNGEGYCDVSVTEATGTIYAQMRVSEVGSHMLGASFVSNGIMVPIGSTVFDTEALSIRTNGDTISNQSEYVNVYTTPYTNVSLYLGDNEEPLAGTTNAVGRVRFNFTGPSGLKLYDKYTIRAVTEAGSKEYTYKFYPKDAVIAKLGFNYLGKDHDVILNDIDQNPNYIYSQKAFSTPYDVDGGVYWTFYTTLDSSYVVKKATLQVFMMDDSYIMVPLTFTESADKGNGITSYSFSGTKLLEKVNGTSMVPNKFLLHYSFEEDTEFDTNITSQELEAKVSNIQAVTDEVNVSIEEELTSTLEDINSDMATIYDNYVLENDTDITKEEFRLDAENVDIGDVLFNNQYKLTNQEWFEDMPQDGQEIMIQYEESLNAFSDYLSELFGLPKSFSEYSSWDEVYEDMGYSVDSNKTIEDYTEEELTSLGYVMSEDKSYAYRCIDENGKISVGNTDANVTGLLRSRSAEDGGYTEIVNNQGTHTCRQQQADIQGGIFNVAHSTAAGELLNAISDRSKGFVKWLCDEKNQAAAERMRNMLGVTNNAAVSRFLAVGLSNIFGAGLNIQSLLDLWGKLNEVEDDILDVQDEIDRLKKLRVKYAKLSTEDGCFLGSLVMRENCITTLDDMIDLLVQQKNALTLYMYNLQDELWTNLFNIVIGYCGPVASGTGRAYTFTFSLLNEWRKESNQKKANLYGNLASEWYASADLYCGAADNYGQKGSPCTGTDEEQESGTNGGVISGRKPNSGTVTNGRNPSATNPALDPSGIVYEAVESNTMEGVTATVWYSENSDGSDAVIWNAEEWDQINPQITGKEGFYQWDVPTGYYQVVFEKEGYQTARTEWLPVPPPQMNLKTAMVSTKAPQVDTVKAYKRYVEVSFDQYMDTNATLNIDGYTYEWQDIDSGYSKVLRLTYSGTAKETGDTVSFTLNGAKNYAGTELGEYESGSLEVVTKPADIKTNFASIVSFKVGEDTSFSVRVIDEDGNLMKGVKVSATVKNDTFATVGEAELTAEDGRTSMPIKTLLPGMTEITFKVEGTALTKTYQLFISDGDNKPIRPTAVVGATTLDESAPKENYVTVNYGEKLVLNCATEGVKIYYTTNDTCPCQDTADRHEYTGPITLTENTYFRIAAYKDGMEYSERLNITVTVHKHSYGAPEFIWAANGKSATARFTCSCGDTFTGKATVTSAMEKAATYTVMGTTKYTAKVTYNGKTYTATKSVQDIAKKKLATPGITSIANASGGITIKYSKVTGANGYIIYRKAGTGSWTQCKTTTALSYTDTTATTDKTIYQYKVCAYVKDAGGTAKGSTSAVKSIVRVGCPTLKSVENTAKGISVKWTKVTGASGYYLYRSVNGGAFMKYTTIKDGTRTSYTDTKATTTGTKYAYKLVAYRTVSGKTIQGSSSASKSIVRVGNTTIQSVENAAKGISVKWTKVTGASGYYLYRSVNGGAFKKYTTIKGGTRTSYTDTKATTSGAKYAYKIVAYKTVSGKTTQGSSSASKTIVRVSRPTLKSVENATKGISVKWTKVTGASGYYLYRSVNGGTFKKYATIKGGTRTSYTDTKATTNGAKYSYKIVAYKTVSGKTYTSVVSSVKSTYRKK